MIQLTQLGHRAGAVLAAMAAFAVMLLVAPPPAFAHTDPSIVTRLASIKPDLPSGVQMVVIDGEVTQLGLSNSSTTPVLALDPDGRPFLSVSNQGVLGDTSSRYLQAFAGEITSATPAHPECCPDGEWKRLSDKGGWSWADPGLDPRSCTHRKPVGTAAWGSCRRAVRWQRSSWICGTGISSST